MSQPNDRRLPWYVLVAGVWLLFVGAWTLGFASYHFEMWPHGPVKAAWLYVTGIEGEEKNLADRLENDFGNRPARHMVTPRLPFDVPAHYTALEGLPLAERRVEPLAWLHPSAPRGYRLLFGSFDFKEGLHGAVLLGPELEIVRTWVVSQADTTRQNRGDEHVYPHGVELLADGSLLVAFDEGSAMLRYGTCGETLWKAQGGYHHSISLDGEGAAWTWAWVGGPTSGSMTHVHAMVKVDLQDGRVLEQFSLGDVHRENPGIDPLGIRQVDVAQRSTWANDPFHPNDVEPLPAHWADAYPQFDAGDLLISLRSVNLVAVIDPLTAKIKWWRQGLVRRQHDPDWNARGTITIYDNNMHRDVSRIVEIDPQTYEASVALPGQPYDFYSWRRGKHDAMPDGGFIVTSSEQGRVFETNAEGEIVFEFINRYDTVGENLLLSEARFFPLDYFAELATCKL